MIDALYALPDWALLLAWASALAVLFVVMSALTHRVPRLRPNADNSDFVLRLQATLFTITGFVVAFTLVEALSNLRKVDTVVTAEASAINRLDRLLFKYGHDTSQRVRPELLEYARSVVADEWPAMQRGASARTGQDFADVSNGILALEPAPGWQTVLYSEILRSYDAVAEARDARLGVVTVSLGAGFWQAITFAVLLLLFVSSTIERNFFRTVILGCQMAVLGTFIGFVFILDQPFKGRSAVKPVAIAQAIAVIEDRRR